MARKLLWIMTWAREDICILEVVLVSILWLGDQSDKLVHLQIVLIIHDEANIYEPVLEVLIELVAAEGHTVQRCPRVDLDILPLRHSGIVMVHPTHQPHY